MTMLLTAGSTTQRVAAPNTHSPVEVYERCQCDPGEPDFTATHFMTDDGILTCARGLLYRVCAHCCCGTNEQRCESTHQHGSAHPWCQVTAALVRRSCSWGWSA